MAKIGGLGKGLGALMNEAENEVDSSFSVAQTAAPVSGGEVLIDIDKLQPNPQQPRTEFDPEALQELAESIKENGVIQPILVEEAENGMYYIIAGERRTRASKIAGLKQVPVRIKSYSEEKKLEIALIENIQRENLNPLEEALAYKKLMEMTQITQDDVASRVGKKRSTVANALRLLKLPEDMQTSLADGKITAGHARALLSVPNSTEQRILFGKIMGQGLSVREAERLASEINGTVPAAPKTAKPKPEEKRNPDLVNIEQQFIEALGTKVVLKGDLEKGSIQIDYFNKDDLDRLYSIIVR